MSIVRSTSILAALLCAGAAGAQKPAAHAKPAVTAGAHDTTRHEATKAAATKESAKEHAKSATKDSAAHARAKSTSKKPPM